MSERVAHRMRIDEIEPNRDGELVATLVDDAGRAAVVPADLLPDGARPNRFVEVAFKLDEPATSKRRSRIQRLQHRLFHRRGDNA